MWNQVKRSISLIRSFRHAAVVPLRKTYVQGCSANSRVGVQQNRFNRLYSVSSETFLQVTKPTSLGPDSTGIGDESIAQETTDQQEESWMELGDFEVDEEVHDEFKGISLERGITGVFDIEELIAILHRENLTDIVTIAIPPELYFVDYMVITTGRSPKQMAAVAEFIRKLFKRKALDSDPLPVIEGKGNKDWIAMDLGNIALHIFSTDTRQTYDLETLWTCGAKYDDLSQETEDPFAAFKAEFQNPRT